MNSGIYKLTFANGQFYIGKSENIPKRWKTHETNFVKGTHTNKMQAVYDQYGPPEYRVALRVHPDHIDIYEGIFIATAWGPQLLNTTKPRPIDPQTAEEYLDVYDNLEFNGESCMLYSTLEHCKALRKSYSRWQECDGRVQELKANGVVIPEELDHKLEDLEYQLQAAHNTIHRLKTRTLWQRITNQMV